MNKCYSIKSKNIWISNIQQFKSAQIFIKDQIIYEIILQEEPEKDSII
jgi:hypothetical protein